MEEKISLWKGALTTAAAMLTALWGWFGWLLVAWVVCMALCVSAVAAAGILDLVAGQLTASAGQLLPFTYTVFLCPLVVGWYLLTEVGSIIENAGAMGAPLPQWLKKAVAALRDQVDGKV